MIHSLKLITDFFDDVLSGRKSFEIRQNDRNFKVGDYLALNEIILTEQENTPPQCSYTGRSCMVYVDYILQDERYLPQGYVAMSIKPCAVIRTQQDRYELDIPPIKWLEVPCIYGAEEGRCARDE